MLRIHILSEGKIAKKKNRERGREREIECLRARERAGSLQLRLA
jgi:hypothetical protein